MNKLTRYIFIAVTIGVIAVILWYFINIVAYIIAAGVISLVGRPLVDFMGNIKIKNFKLPLWFAALFALVLIWFLLISFFSVFIPLVASQANELSNIDVNDILKRLEKPLQSLNELFFQYNIGDGEYSSIEEYAIDKLSSVLNISMFSSLLSTMAGLLGDIFIAAFSISFIAFFFLKDKTMFSEGIVVLVPTKHETAVRNALTSARRLLVRYFIGIGGQITGIIILDTIGLSIVGLDFQRSLLIGFFAGLFNVMPYVGPIIGTVFGLILGSVGYIDLEMTQFLLKFLYMTIVFLTVQLIDNMFFQPLIYGSSVNAHPLEIFLVILIAGSLAGIPGMILAVPVYTIFRVFAREFLYKFKVIKKITQKMP